MLTTCVMLFQRSKLMNKKVLLKRKNKFCDGMKDIGKEDDDYEILTFFSNCKGKVKF